MDYKFLIDGVYLTLLCHYNGMAKPSFVKLSEETGMTRQTVSKRFNDLVDKGLIVVRDNVIFVNNDFGIDIEFLESLLEKYDDYKRIGGALYYKKFPYATSLVAMAHLGISHETYYKSKLNLEHRS